MILPRKTKT